MADVWAENDLLPGEKILVSERQFRVMRQNGWRETDPPTEVEESVVRVRPGPEVREPKPNKGKSAPVEREPKPNLAQREAIREAAAAEGLAAAEKAAKAATKKAAAKKAAATRKKNAAKSSSDSK